MFRKGLVVEFRKELSDGAREYGIAICAGFFLLGVLDLANVRLPFRSLPAILAFPVGVYLFVVLEHLHYVVLPMRKTYRFNSIALFLAGLTVPVVLVSAFRWTSVALL